MLETRDAFLSKDDAMPPVASQKRRRIASRACDLCRDRKVQCVFDGEATTCRRCLKGNTECLFLTERRPRGPYSKKQMTSAVNLPIGHLAHDYFCSHRVFLTIIDDYLDLVYPLLPLVHRPSFRTLVESQAYTTDPVFFRLCIALCAATVASIPRKFDSYGGGKYANVGAMVDRACHMVLLSRIASEPEWQNRPSMNTMLVSILLTMASHYAGRPNQGWGYASEAIQFFRALELYTKRGYENLTVLERELCKRAFWVLYIIQIHDRLSFIVPHTGLSFDPLMTDWEYLLPNEVEDEDLASETHTRPEYSLMTNAMNSTRPLPVISGFIALIKVFLCVVDLLSNGFPGSPPQAYAMTSGSLRRLIYSDDSDEQTQASPAMIPSRSTISLTSLLCIIKKLQSTLAELPEELKISTIDPQLQSPSTHTERLPMVSHQFDIMRANIHITSLYIQSTILEACSGTFTNASVDNHPVSPGDETTSIPGYTPRRQLWTFRESIARELLEVLNFCAPRTLEANGSSMIVKIREIAATLLDSENELEVSSEREAQSRQYVSQFADILANLDYIGHSTIIPPIFSTHS